MSERGIIFSAPMVRALLEGRKTQTRRLITPRNDAARLLFFSDWTDSYILDPGNSAWRDRAHGFAIGDRLYVREACNTDWCDKVIYRADGGSARDAGYASEPKWRPSIHMPRWASRLTLTVTDVRVQRLQDISECDAVAEGCAGCLGPNPDFPDEWDPTPQEEFHNLWNSLHDKPGTRWDDNPWLYALTFTVAQGNIDQEDSDV